MGAKAPIKTGYFDILWILVYKNDYLVECTYDLNVEYTNDNTLYIWKWYSWDLETARFEPGSDGL